MRPTAGHSDTGSAAPSAGLSALLSNVIDYAGLFPPATLDMAATVRNYAAYLAHEDAWLLERLVVPVARLDEFEQHATELLPRDAGEHDADAWPISALTAPATLDADLERIDAFNETHTSPERGLALVDVIELKAGSIADIEHGLDVVPDDIFPFFEIAPDADLRGLVAALAGGDAGAKLRTGGVSADLYPPTATVARFIATCAAADVPLKFTAGMHHPLGGYQEAVGARELGFLNAFTAAALAMYNEIGEIREIGERELVEILEEASIDAFTFDQSGLAWRGHRLRPEQIEDARMTFAVSFGSCSFDEPRDDLRALGLL